MRVEIKVVLDVTPVEEVSANEAYTLVRAGADTVRNVLRAAEAHGFEPDWEGGMEISVVDVFGLEE